MQSRIKELRKALDMTQEEFGSKIGLVRNSIANYEIGRREPTNSVILSICREFNVSEEWLRNGNGEMFIELLPEDEFVAAAAELSRDNDKIAMQAVVEYWKLDENSKKIFRDFLVKIVENSKNKD